jgi:hypothetical protein
MVWWCRLARSMNKRCPKDWWHSTFASGVGQSNRRVIRCPHDLIKAVSLMTYQIREPFGFSSTTNLPALMYPISPRADFELLQET